jgi:hypothetical protein
MDFEQQMIRTLIEPYEKMLVLGNYPYSPLDGWMMYDVLFKIIHLSESDREEYKQQSYAITLRGEECKETPEAYEKRVIKNAKHLAFKDWIQSKAMEQFDLRTFVLTKIKNDEVHS